MRAVNLLPRDLSRQRRLTAESLPALVGAGTGVAVVAVLAGAYLIQSSKVSDAQQQLDAAKAQLASTPLPPPVPKLPPAPVTPAVVTNEQQPRLMALSAALSQRIAWDRILREFSLVLPSDVWLSTLTMSAPTTGAAASTSAASSFIIGGSTYSYDSVARLLSRLSLIPDLTGVSLTNTANDGRLVQFTVGATVKGAPAPAAPVTPPVGTDTTSTDTTSGSGA